MGKLSVEREIKKRDIQDCFDKLMRSMYRENQKTRLEDVFRAVAQSEAPRFYVTYENARRFISLLSRKKRLPIVNDNKIAMYNEIYRRYKQQVKDVDKRYKYIILEKIIKEPAPSFYLEDWSVRGYIYKNHKYEKRNTQ